MDELKFLTEEEMMKGYLNQLHHTRDQINELEHHPHYTDDCGEYLRSALELSAFLVSSREDGIEALEEAYITLARIDSKLDKIPADEWIYETNLWQDYASDGISSEVNNIVEKLVKIL